MKDTAEIEKLYESMSGRLYNISLRIVGCMADAEEIMHDSLLQYWKFKRKEEICDLKGWLTSICIRKSLDKLREKHRNKDFLEEYKEWQETEASTPPENLNIEEIKKALLLLPDNYRTILSLHLFEGYDYQEIEQITGTKETTLRSLYSRAKEKLAAAIYKAKKL